MERDGRTNRTKHKAQHLIIHGFKMMRAVFPSLDERVFDPPKAASRRKGLCKNPDLVMPDDPRFSYPQQRANNELLS